MTQNILIAVNGTLMRGLELNGNMLKVGGVFVKEAETDSHYRLWSIHDRYPGMIRTLQEGNRIALEIWSLPAASLADLLLSEPAGLSVGKIKLSDGSEVPGILAEPWLVENQPEITKTGGWRTYISKKY